MTSPHVRFDEGALETELWSAGDGGLLVRNLDGLEAIPTNPIICPSSSPKAFEPAGMTISPSRSQLYSIAATTGALTALLTGVSNLETAETSQTALRSTV